ncbi:MAG: dephospho-CoA kinase [Xanthomonadales bacterium]|nr:dephospho-CoA kinase [Xanthomonadales bacterium]
MSAESADRLPLLVGLTGGVATGKSTVSELFAQRGVPVIDADVIARELVEPGEAALAEIVTEFGEHVLDADGRLDRGRMRRVVFANPRRRKRLEQILHPLVRERMFRKAREVSHPYCILAVPLLIEGGLHDTVDRILVIDVPVAIQRERLARRDGSRPEQIEAMLAAQVDRATRLNHADDVIDNSGPLEALDPEVDRLDAKYRKEATLRGRSAGE